MKKAADITQYPAFRVVNGVRVPIDSVGTPQQTSPVSSQNTGSPTLAQGPPQVVPQVPSQQQPPGIGSRGPPPGVGSPTAPAQGYPEVVSQVPALQRPPGVSPQAQRTNGVAPPLPRQPQVMVPVVGVRERPGKIEVVGEYVDRWEPDAIQYEVVGKKMEKGESFAYGEPVWVSESVAVSEKSDEVPAAEKKKKGARREVEAVKGGKCFGFGGFGKNKDK